ncbi:MAG: hypothetical protein ACXAEI_01375 [Candidatus Hodarchaeales archaeon]
MKGQTDRMKGNTEAFTANKAKTRLLILTWFIMPLLFFSVMSTSGSLDFSLLGTPSLNSVQDTYPEANCTACHSYVMTATDCEDCHNGSFTPLPSTMVNGTIKFTHHNTTHPIQTGNPPDCDASDCHGTTSDYRQVDRYEVNMTEYCTQAGCHSPTIDPTDPWNDVTCGKCHTSQPTARATSEKGTTSITSALLALSALLTTLGLAVVTGFIFRV